MAAANWALLALRAGAGLIILIHGLNHARTRDFAASRFEANGYRLADLQIVASIITQVGAGILLIAGLLTSFAAAALIAVMLEAFWTVHRENGFFVFKAGVGWEFVAMLALVGFVVAMLGPGEASLDHAVAIDTDLDGLSGFLIGLGGLALATLHLLLFFRPPEERPED